jgi:hypothetical protein
MHRSHAIELAHRFGGLRRRLVVAPVEHVAQIDLAGGVVHVHAVQEPPELPAAAVARG